jgi:hypothetical protein
MILETAAWRALPVNAIENEKTNLHTKVLKRVSGQLRFSG